MRLWLALGLWFLSPSLYAASLLIIIDDLGNNYAAGAKIIALPSPLNLAFLPHTPQAPTLAQQAHQQGHGILLHAPMASIHHNKLGPGGLYPDMDKDSLQQTFEHSLASIPHVQGFNNHMGSLLTTQPQAMQWIMQAAKRHNLYFVDSLTSANSVAARQARLAGLAVLKRHVFLDNERDPDSLQRQFSQALSLAKHQGHAVLIGHPYPETIAFLEQALVQLLPQNIQLMRIDRFLQNSLWQSFQNPEPYYSKFQLQ